MKPAAPARRRHARRLRLCLPLLAAAFALGPASALRADEHVPHGGAVPENGTAEEAPTVPPEPRERAARGEADWLLPEWKYEPGDDWGITRRVGGRSAKIGWDFVNDSVSDSWYTLSSPLRWRWRQWLIVGAAAGTTTGLIFLADEPLRDVAIGSARFHQFGENVRWVGQGGALLGLTGGFLISGLALDRPKDIETMRLLLEASLIGQGYGLALKYTAGRARPRTNEGPRSFDAFSGDVSMPSGEALNTFLLAGVVTSQYPWWPVQIVSYGVAGLVGAGRIALDAHWGSDIFVSAVIGIAVSKTVVKLNRIRARDRARRREMDLAGRSTPSLRKRKGRHYFGATARSVHWTYVF